MTQRGAQRPGQTTPLGLRGQKKRPQTNSTMLIRHHITHPYIHTVHPIQTRDTHAMSSHGFSSIFNSFIGYSTHMRAYEISVSVCSLEHFSSSWMSTGWLVGAFDILQSHDQEQGSPSQQYLLVIWSFGHHGDALSQQTAVS